MKFSFKRLVIRGSIVLISIVSFLLILLLIIPVFFADTISDAVKETVKKNIKGDIEFASIDLSFYKHFPLLTVSIEKPIIQGVQVDSIAQKSLLMADNIALGVDVMSLLKEKMVLNAVYVDNPALNVIVNQEGKANYDIFIETDDKETDDEPLDLLIDRIDIKRANVLYRDDSSNVHIKALGFDYLGQGDMSSAIFLLKSMARIDSFDFVFDGVHYVKEKPILGKLVTKVDTKALRFVFEKNNLKIKELPVDFKGEFGFVEGGYDMHFDIKTDDAKLDQLLSILPPEYQGWLDNTSMTGDVSGKFLLDGKYIAADSIAPIVDLGLTVKNGIIKNASVNSPIRDFNLAMKYTMKDLNPEHGILNVDKFNFSLDGGNTEGNLIVEGIAAPVINTKITSNLNLELFQKTIGLTKFDLKGIVDLNLEATGKFEQKVVTRKLKKGKIINDTIISSIPRFKLMGSINNGYFKESNLPEALSNINFGIDASCDDSNYKKTKISLKEINIEAMNHYVKGNFALNGLDKFDIDANVKAKVVLQDLKQFLPMNDEVEVRGKLLVDGMIKGTFEPKKRRFPVIDSEVKLEEGYLKFVKLPELPVENISIHTQIKSARGSMNDLTIRVLPITFKIANEPFKLDASLYNLNNLNYTVKSKGTLNIGSIYKIFKIDGLDVKGLVKTNLYLSGLQSDATNGNYDKLKNGGKFEINNITITSQLFPKPLVIKQGVFSFYKEKMKFDKFVAKYGSSNFSMNGYVTNVVSFMLNKGVLKGSFDLETENMNVDEFMVFGPATPSTKSTTKPKSSGVIQVPNNFDLTFNAKAKKIKYTDYILEDFTGTMKVNESKIYLENTTFNMIGTKVAMDALYAPTGLRSANFDYSIKASDFDIQRAYKEVKLFREMVSMAKDAYGQVSLDYKLAGRLNGDMFPVMRSLEGKGILTLENIKFKGFKLLGGIAEKTETKSLEEGTLTEVAIKSSVKDNVLTIERTKTKMAGFRPRFEGQISLDGEMNIGFRLGLPPMGIIGIPMRITGNSEDFKIKLGKYKPSEVLGKSGNDEEEDEDEQPQQTDSLSTTKPVIVN
ncbi:MAG: AsmA family protein [Flavobacteriaceae bacterium]|nr:AsmA family protein [Flavobacteriaceae bacterium]